jgi:hypothetical protein
VTSRVGCLLLCRFHSRNLRTLYFSPLSDFANPVSITQETQTNVPVRSLLRMKGLKRQSAWMQ